MWNMNIEYPAFEDGPDRGFRNVGKINPAVEDGPNRGFQNVGKIPSDAGEIPKRTYTILKTQRKFEIKITYITLIQNLTAIGESKS
jgi:hypothetical protein